MLVAEKHKEQKASTVDYGLVSIIMPNYNSEKYIEATIKSVLAQTYQNWELLFVDDCSSDTSLELARTFQDERIRVFLMKENGGAALARNRAIEEAKGRWIAFLDSDDLWAPQKLETQITYMQNNGISFSYTDYEVIDENNTIISTFKPRIDVCKYKDILKHNHIGCLTVIYDSEKLGKVFMPTNAIKREDMACWLSVLKKGEVAHCLHECLAQYKVHSDSISSNKLKMMKHQWQVYRKVEKLSLVRSFYYMAHWAVKGFLKYK